MWCLGWLLRPTVRQRLFTPELRQHQVLLPTLVLVIHRLVMQRLVPWHQLLLQAQTRQQKKENKKKKHQLTVKATNSWRESLEGKMGHMFV